MGVLALVHETTTTGREGVSLLTQLHFYTCSCREARQACGSGCRRGVRDRETLAIEATVATLPIPQSYPEASGPGVIQACVVLTAWSLQGVDNYNSWKERMSENVENSALLEQRRQAKGTTDRGE